MALTLVSTAFHSPVPSNEGEENREDELSWPESHSRKHRCMYRERCPVRRIISAYACRHYPLEAAKIPPLRESPSWFPP